MTFRPNEPAELLHEIGASQVGTANASKLVKCARMDAILKGKIRDIDRHAVLAQRARDREDDPRYPTQDKNRALQRVPLTSASKLQTTGRQKLT